jgi:hypothetical protein
MEHLIPVESDSTIARDLVSNAIVSIDKNKLASYKKHKKLLLTKDQRINILDEKLKQLEQIVNKLISEKDKEINGNNNTEKR